MKLPIVYPFITHKPPEAYVFSILGAYPQTQSWLISNYIDVLLMKMGKAIFGERIFFIRTVHGCLKIIFQGRLLKPVYMILYRSVLPMFR